MPSAQGHITIRRKAKDGESSYYAGCQEYYATSASRTTPPIGYPNDKPYTDGVATYSASETVSIGSGWHTSMPSATKAKPYIWNFEISRDSRGNQYVVYPICIGNFSLGLQSIEETYAISAFSAPDSTLHPYPTDISTWTGEQQSAAPTKQKPYQWNRTVVTYNDGSTETHYHVSAVRGNDGQTGPKGDDGDRGADGVSPYSLTSQYSTIPVQCEAGGTTSDAMTNFEVELTLRRGTTRVPINSIQGYSVVLEKGASAYPTHTFVPGSATDKLRLTIPPGTQKDSIAPIVTVSVKSGSTVVATCSIAFPIAQKGLPGDVQATVGVLRYYNGVWDAAKTYYYTDTTAPIVKYGNSYYALKDTAASRAGIKGNIYPPTQTTYWTEVSYRTAYWMEMLFANFARLGAAVFYGNLMFSAYGSFLAQVPGASMAQNVPYDYPDAIAAIRANVGDDFSTCPWQPYYYVNLSTGKVYMENAVVRGLLTERFLSVKDTEDTLQVIAMDASQAHHISFEHHSNVKALLLPMRTSLSGVVINSLPTPVSTTSMASFVDEGVSVRVANQFVREGILSTRQGNAESSVLLCSDPRMFIPSCYRGSGSSLSYNPSYPSADYEGYFVHNGVRSKFILLPPGYQARLTLLDTYDAINNRYYRYWYVEGGFDLVSVAMTVRVYKTASDYWERGYVARTPGPQVEQGDEAFLAPSWIVNGSGRKITIDLYGSQGNTLSVVGFGV